MGKIKILLADDHAVVRKGMKMLLEDEPMIEIIGEAVDGIDALEKIGVLLPNIVILDLTMPNMNGIEAISLITKSFKTVKVIVFSMHNNSDYIIKSVENGAFGYLTKDSSKEVILKAIFTVMEGKKYFPIDISGLIIDDLLSKNKKIFKAENESNQTVYSLITSKEKEILEFIIQGKNSREIAEKLNLSIRTVDNHRANMMKKTKAKNTADLVKMAIG
ncbi:MAG: response regulator transcription factor [Bacteroidota bacterium]